MDSSDEDDGEEDDMVFQMERTQQWDGQGQWAG